MRFVRVVSLDLQRDLEDCVSNFALGTNGATSVDLGEKLADPQGMPQERRNNYTETMLTGRVKQRLML